MPQCVKCKFVDGEREHIDRLWDAQMFCWQKIRVHNSYKDWLVFTKIAKCQRSRPADAVRINARLSGQATDTPIYFNTAYPIIEATNTRWSQEQISHLYCWWNLHHIWTFELKTRKFPYNQKVKHWNTQLNEFSLKCTRSADMWECQKAAMHVNIDGVACVLTFHKRIWVGLRTLLDCLQHIFQLFFYVLCGEIVLLVRVFCLLFVLKTIALVDVYMWKMWIFIEIL